MTGWIQMINKIDKRAYCTYTTQSGNTKFLMHSSNHNELPRKQIHRFYPLKRICLICNQKV